MPRSPWPTSRDHRRVRRRGHRGADRGAVAAGQTIRTSRALVFVYKAARPQSAPTSTESSPRLRDRFRDGVRAARAADQARGESCTRLVDVLREDADLYDGGRGDPPRRRAVRPGRCRAPDVRDEVVEGDRRGRPTMAGQAFLADDVPSVDPGFERRPLAREMERQAEGCPVLCGLRRARPMGVDRLADFIVGNRPAPDRPRRRRRGPSDAEVEGEVRPGRRSGSCAASPR